MAPLLEVRDLDVHYGPVQALHGVSFAVAEGQILTLLGANGAGKSTSLRTISGLIRPTRGDVLFGGESIRGIAPHKLVERGICHVPEGRGIFPEQSVEENLWLGAHIRRDRGAIKQDMEHVFELFPRVKERLAQRAGTLSGGEQQMLAIGRALLARPRLLLLDEPSLGLAPQIVQTIFSIIRQINKSGTTILLVEQNAHLALREAHYGCVLEAGRVVLSDTAENLRTSGEVQRAYLGH